MGESKNDRICFVSEDVTDSLVKKITELIVRANIEDDEREEKEKNYERKPIKLYINSYGGDAYGCFAISSAILSSKTPVHTYVYGYVMSAGLAIAVCGHKRFASEYATFMYHQVLGWVSGGLERMKHEVGETERVMEIYNKIILDHTQVRRDDLNRTREKQLNWYLPADEAKKLGFFDEYIA